MAFEKKGEKLYTAFDAFMPCFFRYINPVIHQFSTGEYNLNENQIKVIMALSLLDEATPTQLSQCLLLQKGSLTTIIRSLISLGLIYKLSTANDKRKYFLGLTDKAKNLIATKKNMNIKSFEQLFSDMPAEDVGKVIEGLKVLCDYLIKVE